MMRHRLLIAVALLALTGCETGTIRVGNGYAGDPQQAQNWCWAACISTVLNELVDDPGDRSRFSQQWVAEQVFGGDIDDGASDEVMVRLLDGYRMTYRFPYGRGAISYTIHAELINGLPTVDQLKPLNNDKDRRVIVLLPHHAVILREAEYEGSTITSWEIYDPFPRRGGRKIAERDAKDESSDDHIEGAIIIRLDD